MAKIAFFEIEEWEKPYLKKELKKCKKTETLQI